MKVGLNNLGNTCYMNSIIQALYMTKQFRNDVLTTDREMQPLFTKLQILFGLLLHSPRPSLAATDFAHLVRPPGFQPGIQYDSAEFLAFFLEALHEQERSALGGDQIGDAFPHKTSEHQSPHVTAVQRSFGGQALSTTRCDKCKIQSEHTENFRELQLSFPSKCSSHSTQTLLDYYLQPQKLCGDNQYHCNNCQGLTNGERATRITTPPLSLVLTIKHFRYDPDLHQHTKLLEHLKLDTSVHIDDGQYVLYAAVFHVGQSLNSGHYYTIARDGQDW